MREIKCPNCGEVFQVDETGYAQILKQVRDEEFNKEIERREAELARQNKSDIELVRMKEQQDAADKLSEKENKLKDMDREIQKLRAENISQALIQRPMMQSS